jgi:hypothetical protein
MERPAVELYLTDALKPVMAMPVPDARLSRPDSAERSRLLAADEMRKRARLYARRAAVEYLIQSLERYQRSQDTSMAECLGFSTEREPATKVSARVLKS